MNTDLSHTLQNGNVIGFAEYGDASGFPVFYFHGGQESRLSSVFMDNPASHLGIRIIAPDRPGIGLSSFQEKRTFLDWGKNINELADFLGFKSFSVFGLSGGAPHVLGCLQYHSERIEKASIVAGATPYNYKGTLKGMWFPVKIIHWLASMKSEKLLRKFIQNDLKGLIEKPEKRITQFQKFLPKPDRELMKKNPGYGREFIKGSIEGYRQGIDGVIQEWKLYVNDWGMDLTKVKSPVTLWYGSDDKMAPTQRGLYYKSQLPDSKLNLLEDEGHFSLIRNHLEEILIDLKPNS